MIYELKDWIVWILGGLFCSGVIFEIVPIKISPISSILKWIGKKMNAETSKEIKEVKETVHDLDKKLQNISEQVDKNEVDRIRWEILDFANSCKNKRRHTKDEFLHIIELNQKYHAILEEHKLTNGVVDLEYDYIEEVYMRCSHENSFL